MSDTPRTDAVKYQAMGQFQDVVAAEFARELERELNTLANLRDEAVDNNRVLVKKLCELERENKTLHAQVALDHRAKGLMLLESHKMREAMREAWLIMEKVDNVSARDWMNKNERFYL